MNKFLRGKSEGANIHMLRMASKVCSIKSRPFLIPYYNLIFVKGDDSMNLMELRLQGVLQENRADFIDSLRLSGIDVEHNG